MLKYAICYGVLIPFAMALHLLEGAYNAFKGLVKGTARFLEAHYPAAVLGTLVGLALWAVVTAGSI